MLLGVDLGTTHCKAGLFAPDGALVRLAARPSNPQPAAHGWVYDPEGLWEAVAAVMREAAGADGPAVQAVGIASMAESGLLVDAATGQPRTPIVPWFDPAASAAAERLGRAGDPAERFFRSGIYASFKCSLAKILWLREREPAVARGARWLGAADYAAFRLTGQMATDYSLAGRTYAFRVDELRWDDGWLAELDLDASLFPPARPSGEPLGRVTAAAAAAVGLRPGAPVAVAGHDHVCAAFAAGTVAPGRVFDSMGTAETLLGALPARGAGERPLGASELSSGLNYGCHVARDVYYWLGGLSASGGSVEWLRAVLGEPPLAYDDLASLLQATPDEPGSVLFIPYLAGSGAPHTDQSSRGAFVGLSAAHGRSHLVRAVLEGTAYEMELIRRAAVEATGQPISLIRAAGGGTRLSGWLQIKADVSGCRLEVLDLPDASLLGAALLAGVGGGVFSGEAEALRVAGGLPAHVVEPRPEHHARYRAIYERVYAPVLAPLRSASQHLACAE